ncbi:MAG: GNAT family N-acetyltransferase [Bdellovibrio sp.]|jgi:putative hemolysin
MLEFYRLRSHRIHKFKPKIHLVSDKGPFLLKTISSSDELIEALRLRYQVFHREMLGKTRENGIDVDEFDFICDHLAIIDKKTGRMVGTYRLNCSAFSNQFYSSQEFNLRRILEPNGTKLELGRACIHKDFRKGLVIALLWRGIAEYMAATNSDVLFGCASIKTESARQAALLYNHFHREGRIQANLMCPPTKAFSMSNLGVWIEKLNRPFTAEEIKEVEDLIPPLCRAYLKAGAFLGGEPAYDPEFKCIDFLTILPRSNLNKVLWKKYGKENDSAPDASEPQATHFHQQAATPSVM